MRRFLARDDRHACAARGDRGRASALSDPVRARLQRVGLALERDDRPLRKNGWTKAELNNWNYNTSQSNATTAKEVATKVSEILKSSGAMKVDLITHSMGALSTRYYIKNLGGESKVEDWVSLGGPNHGTTLGNWCADASCVEMRPKSTFLNQLNAGSETPGPVRYGTWWSPCDEIINPHTSVILTGETNTETECISHVALTTNEKVYTQVREFVR